MLKKSKVAAVFAAIALAVSSAPASNAATDKQLEIFTWWHQAEKLQVLQE